MVYNPDLAQTLSLIARDGADTFYTGEIAESIVADMEAHGGLITAADLASYEPRILDPITSTYKGFTVTTNHPPGGGPMLLEMLNILENFDLATLGHNSPEYIRIVGEAMKYATIDKDRFIGDPMFVDVPVEKLISKDYARTLSERIAAKEKADVPRFSADGKCTDTTQVSIVDHDGNCVSMTHSIGMSSGVVTDGLGILYNGCMGVFDPRPGLAGSIAPGKARFSSICPSIIFRDGSPYIVVGAPGATQISMGVLQTILNVLEFGNSMSDAVSLPRFSATSNAIDVTNRIPRFVTAELEKEGYQIIRSPMSFGVAWVHGIRMTKNGPEGGADPGTDGMSLTC